MTSPPDTQPPDHEPPDYEPPETESSYPGSEDLDPMEEEQPRRAASAEFEVAAEIGMMAAMRDAMDPANQSLADALRLSFRVLQLVILILVALFAVSGAKTVEQGETGVATRWGKIVEHEGEVALSSGLHLNWPYPAGNFHLFAGENRAVGVKYAFRPLNSEESRRTSQAAISEGSPAGFIAVAFSNAELLPAIMTSDGDLAHVEFTATYDVEDVGDFVRQVRVQDSHPNTLVADRLVRLILERAAIHAGAALTFDQVLAEQGVEFRDRLRQVAQHSLDDLGTGIRLTQINIEEVGSPQEVEEAETELQRERNRTDDQIVKARGEAEQNFIGVAGRESGAILDLIELYEIALDQGDADRSALLLDRINEQLESDTTTGEAATTIANAHLFRSQVESVLGNEARRFAGLLPAYREHPELIVGQYWFRAYKSVMSREDVELFWLPPGTNRINIATRGLDSVQNIRRDLALQRSERKTMLEQAGAFLPYIRRARDYEWSREHRRLQRDKEGNLSPN